MSSLKRRLILGLSAGLIICIAAAGFYFHGLLHSILRTDFDADLRQRAETLALGLSASIRPEYQETVNHLGAAALAEAAEGASTRIRAELQQTLRSAVRLQFTLDPRRLQEFEPGPGASFFRIRRGTEELARSASWPAGPAALALEGRHAGDVDLPDGRRGRGMVLGDVQVPLDQARFNEPLRVLFPEGLAEVFGVDVLLARGREDLEERIDSLQRAFLGVVAALALGAILAAAWAVRSALLPLAELRRRVASVGAGGAPGAIQEDALPAEVRPLAHALNAALQTLQRALERERRISAHIAHELRTPVAELRSAAELAVRAPGDLEALGLLATQAGEIAAQMEHIVVAILRAARAEAGPETRSVIDLGKELAPLIERARTRAHARGMRLDGPASYGLVRADAGALLTIMGVVLDNAVDHTPPGQRARIEIRAAGAALQVRLSNPAPDLLPGDLEKLGEPFWRKDPARAPSGHLGLGLTLATSLARSAGLELRFELERGELSVTLAVPAAAIAT